MKPVTIGAIVAATSVMMYAIFRFLLDSEVAGVAMATTPGLLTSWLQTYATDVPAKARIDQANILFSEWQVAGLFAGFIVVLWAMSLLSLAAFNVAIDDLVARGFLSGSADGFAHLQRYHVGYGLLFTWLPLLCAFGAFLGPRSEKVRLWPYLAGLVTTLVLFVCLRFLLVPGSAAQSLALLQQALTLDIAQVQGGHFIAFVALFGVFTLLLLLIASVPFFVAWVRWRWVVSRGTGV